MLPFCGPHGGPRVPLPVKTHTGPAILAVRRPTAKCQTPDRAGPGFPSSALSSLLLQSHPSSHDVWQSGNVAGIRTSLDSALPIRTCLVYPLELLTYSSYIF